ncbi:ATP-binding protein [Paracoccus aestuarii]|uniref:ATP-binding protein n=1 Tax=Paracoccus aestuarii TaxID=453842 RepID=A0A418ZV74_9RHOB|nr:YifB family Mg chelatase-like AAA ATPase [Paracoccus aestuarii]RJL03391.1 ATP-binding protein [Paracoccus aestuarii]WCR00457.1 YifB family Mg chelatase-like AAA ATPase [Paracoccus aestuarii]
MVAVAYSVAFQGIEARLVEVQCAVAAGLPGFSIVGLPDKAVSEARERVRAAFAALAIALPNKRVTVNLSPADLPKEGSHFDLPIALAVLAALDVVPRDEVARCVALGELALDGRLVAVSGALPAAVAAADEDRTLICPRACGPEAAWIEQVTVLAPDTLRAVIEHLTDRHPIAPARPGAIVDDGPVAPCLSELHGQERAKRAMEVAAAGRHHLLLVGPAGSGKSSLSACMPGLMPPLTAREALETSMVHSVAGLLKNGRISRSAPFQRPHHTASSPAVVGGGPKARPGEISLAHNGVLFLDELPEFDRKVLESLRQPVETGEVFVSRANAHIRYPCRFLLMAAANPCRCGHLADPAQACSRAPLCGEAYMGRISGPLMDRFDLRLDVPAVQTGRMDGGPTGDSSKVVAERVARARQVQAERYRDHEGISVNADAPPPLLEEVAALDREGRETIQRAAERFSLSARGYHRVLRTARTIADLGGSATVRGVHLREALSYRLPQLTAA